MGGTKRNMRQAYERDFLISGVMERDFPKDSWSPWSDILSAVKSHVKEFGRKFDNKQLSRGLESLRKLGVVDQKWQGDRRWSLYRLTGKPLPSEYTREKYGWSNLGGSKHENVRDYGPIYGRHVTTIRKKKKQTSSRWS